MFHLSFCVEKKNRVQKTTSRPPGQPSSQTLVGSVIFCGSQLEGTGRDNPEKMQTLLDKYPGNGLEDPDAQKIINGYAEVYAWEIQAGSAQRLPKEIAIPVLRGAQKFRILEPGMFLTRM